MLKYETIPGTNILQYRVDGPIEQAQYDAAIRHFHDAVAEHGTVNILKEIGTIEGWSRLDIKESMNISIGELAHIGKTAIVTDNEWLVLASRMAGALVKKPVKAFKREDRDAAIAWLSEEAAAA